MRRVIILSIVLLSTMTQSGYCNWRPSKGAYGSVVETLAQSKNVIVAGCYSNDSGIFVSEDGGASWIRVIKSDKPAYMTPNILVEKIVQKGNEDVFYVASVEGIYKLFKNAGTWEIKSIGFQFAALPISDITHFDSHIFVSIWGHGIRKSSDEGQTWNTMNTGLAELNIESLNHAGDTIYAGTEHGLYYSTNQGVGWSLFDQALSDSYITRILVDEKHICLAEFRAGAFVYSKDGSLISRAAQVGTYESSTIPFALINGTLYGHFQNKGLFSTDVNDISWQKLSSDFDNIKPLTMIETNSALLVGVQGFGVFKSLDNGANWEDHSNGMKGFKINAIVAKGNLVFMATSVSGVFISKDYGLTYERVPGTIVGSEFNDLLVKDDVIYLAGHGLFVSDDNGNTWSKKDSRYFTSLAANNKSVYASSFSEGLISSGDKGISWQIVDFEHFGKFIHSIDVNDSMLLVGTHYNGPYLSKNSGKDWESLQNNLIGHAVQSVAFKNNLIFIATGCGVGECPKPTGAYRSFDLGKTWQYLNENFEYAIDKIKVFDGIIFGYFTDKMLYSIDNGTTWEFFSNNIVNPGGRIMADENIGNIESFSASNKYLYLGAGAGMFLQENNLQATVTAIQNLNVAQIQEMQIFPNPSSGRAIVDYFLVREESNIQLNIYNSQGSIIFNTSTGRKPAGYHTFELDLGPHQKGVYLCRLSINGTERQSCKMVIVK